MSAYGAVISLKNNIEYILHSHHCILVDQSHKIIKRAYYPLQPLLEILERLDNTSKSRSRKKVNDWDGQIKEEIWEFEDLLESLVTEQILSQLQSQLIFSFSIDLRCLEDDVDSFVAMLKHMKKKYIYNLEEMPEEPTSSRIGYGGFKCEMIGLRDQFNEVKTSFMRQSSGMCVYSLIGMAGVGKTTLALEIFEDPEIVARYECRGEAWKNKFYQFLNRLVDALEEDVISCQRCLCLENNILFGIKDFCNSVEFHCASSTRSLLFFGPYHQYPIPIYVHFKLLRELDALNLRFYTFPIEILTLIQLKYLALTCNGEVPPTISKLFNLQVLIIHPHMNIRCRRAPSYIPVQIWDMQELKHIEILEKSLQAPNASLEKLLTLVGVNASIGTILKLSERIPNIRKLEVQIELAPYDEHTNLLSCFACISTLECLKIFKFSIINPVIKSGYVVPMTSTSLVKYVAPMTSNSLVQFEYGVSMTCSSLVKFEYGVPMTSGSLVKAGNVVPMTPSSLVLPRGLEKLHLSGMGFPWEYMDVIGSLPFLKVLKLRSYAFQGSTWKTREKDFLRLEFLLIEDSDLVHWIQGSESFPKLSNLSMKHCYKLKEIQWPSYIFVERKIELVNCSPSTLTCIDQLKPRLRARLHVTVYSSFEEKPMTTKFQSEPAELAQSDTTFSTLELAQSDTNFSKHVFVISVIMLLCCLLKSGTLTFFVIGGILFTEWKIISIVLIISKLTELAFSPN